MSTETTATIALTIVREFDAPREVVFAALSQSDQIARWIGPRGYTATTVTYDDATRAWRSGIRNVADDTILYCHGVYHEIAPPERLVYTFAWEEDDAGASEFESMITVTLVDRGGRTEMTFYQTPFRSTESRDGHRGGWSEAFDCLDEFLTGRTTTFDVRRDRLEVVMERVFDAPRELVYDAFIDAEQIPKWWGPRSHRTVVDRLEPHVGGEWRFLCYHEGREQAFHGVFLELDRPRRQSLTFRYEGVPEDTGLVQVVEFEDSGGRTRVTSTCRYPDIHHLDGMVGAGMERGARESWDRFAELIATV